MKLTWNREKKHDMHKFSSCVAIYKALFQSFQEKSAGNQVSQYTLEDTIKYRQVLRRPFSG